MGTKILLSFYRRFFLANMVEAKSLFLFLKHAFKTKTLHPIVWKKNTCFVVNSSILTSRDYYRYWGYQDSFAFFIKIFCTKKKHTHKLYSNILIQLKKA